MFFIEWPLISEKESRSIFTPSAVSFHTHTPSLRPLVCRRSQRDYKTASVIAAGALRAALVEPTGLSHPAFYCRLYPHAVFFVFILHTVTVYTALPRGTAAAGPHQDGSKEGKNKTGQFNIAAVLQLKPTTLRTDDVMTGEEDGRKK